MPEGEPVSLGANRMLAAEIEFVFRMDRALPPRPAPYTRGEVVAAMASLQLGSARNEDQHSRWRDRNDLPVVFAVRNDEDPLRG